MTEILDIIALTSVLGFMVATFVFKKSKIAYPLLAVWLIMSITNDFVRGDVLVGLVGAAILCVPLSTAFVLSQIRPKQASKE